MDESRSQSSQFAAILHHHIIKKPDVDNPLLIKLNTGFLKSIQRVTSLNPKALTVFV